MDARTCRLSQYRARARLLTLAALLLLLSLGGCRSGWRLWPSGEPGEGAQESAAESAPDHDHHGHDHAAHGGHEHAGSAAPGELPQALGQDQWVEAIAAHPGEPGAGGYFWEHRALAAWMVVGGDKAAQLVAELDNANRVAAANAAMMLARAEEAHHCAVCGPHSQAVGGLVRAVKNTELRLALRCAAAETLAHVRDKAAQPALRSLCDEFGQFEGPARAAYVPQLHAELLRSLSRSHESDDNPRFTRALASPAPEVRRMALRAWFDPLRNDLPEAALELRDDADSRVRMTVLEVLAVQQPPEVHDLCARALDDADANVRLAAIAALGQIGGARAREMLERMRKHPAELVRAASIAALGQAGLDDTVIGAAGDKSWRVRQAVAQALHRADDAREPIGGETVELAQLLVHDASVEVQRHTLESIGNWPLPQAGPVLLTALAQGGYQTRKDAARALAVRWPAAAHFPIEGTAEARAAALDELRAQWAREFAPAVKLATDTAASAEHTLVSNAEHARELDRWFEVLRDAGADAAARQQAIEALVAQAPALVALANASDPSALPAAVYDEVLPRVGGAYGIVQKLHSADVQRRRAAAAELIAAAAGKPLPPAALVQLAELAQAESDPEVWQNLLAAIQHDGSEQAVSLAYLAVAQSSVDVRRRACEYLAAHSDPRHTAVLWPMLADPSTPVVQAAVRAIGAGGAVDDPQRLVHLLLTPDKQLRIDVAAALVQVKAAEGLPALERLALDADADVRRQAAAMMGKLGDPAFLPALIGLLAGPLDVRHAALASLAQISGQDFSRLSDGSPAPVDEQARRWQQWYSAQ